MLTINIHNKTKQNKKQTTKQNLGGLLYYILWMDLAVLVLLFFKHTVLTYLLPYFLILNYITY